MQYVGAYTISNMPIGTDSTCILQPRPGPPRFSLKENNGGVLGRRRSSELEFYGIELIGLQHQVRSGLPFNSKGRSRHEVPGVPPGIPAEDPCRLAVDEMTLLHHNT